MGMYCDVSAAMKDDLGRLSGDTDLMASALGTDTAIADNVSLEKSWHGLHYLLTGDAWEGQGPLAFLLAGGEHLDGDEEAPRWFTPEETSKIHQALSGISDEALWSRFDRDELERLEIYPGIWDEPEDDLKEEYLGYFQGLKQVLAVAVQSRRGIVVSIG